MKRSAIFALLFLFAIPLAAQRDVPGILPMPIAPSGITGVVTSVSGNLISVINGAITIDTTGATFSNRKGSASIADVKPGLQISASIVNPEALQPKASFIVILDVPPGSLYGPVQSVDIAGNSFTMYGARIQVTAATRIYGAKTIADIKRGDTLSVELGGSGPSLTADVIQIFPPMPNFSATGTVKSIGTTSWVITIAKENRDIVVTVNAETRIDPAVKVGDNVHVTGISDLAGNVVALSIYSIEPRPTPPPSAMSIYGTVKSIGTTSWVIAQHEGRDATSTVTVTVGPNTKIEPDIKVGDTVLVIGEWDSSRNFVATAITKAPVKSRGSRQ